jgi:NAD(P)-dependent dehydrogenase (short-subunit alcohol dehydrogenase family)
MGRVEGKVALVTGGASGIGKACAERLAAEGATVVITDVQDEPGRATAEAIRAAGGKADYLSHDVTSEEAWVEVIAEVGKRHGRLDVLVNNAGIGLGGSILEFSLADFRRQTAVNLDGVFLGMKHAIPLMRQGGGGSIVNMSSVAGLKGSPNLAAYCATKGGVRLMTKSLALASTRSIPASSRRPSGTPSSAPASRAPTPCPAPRRWTRCRPWPCRWA